jgi:hypothetical protein
MANSVNLPGDLVVPGDIRVTGSITPSIARANILTMVELQPFPIPLTSFRVWNAMATLLPAAGATDDLGLVGGSFGTATPSLRTEDLKQEAVNPTLNYARVLVQLPWEYVAGNTVTLRFKAGMITTVADVSATVDCSAYKLQNDPDDALGSDLVTTAATSINSLTFDDINFTVTPSGLSPGDILDVRIVTAVTDTNTLTAVIAGITSAKLLCDVR